MHVQNDQNQSNIPNNQPNKDQPNQASDQPQGQVQQEQTQQDQVQLNQAEPITKPEPVAQPEQPAQPTQPAMGQDSSDQSSTNQANYVNSYNPPKEETQSEEEEVQPIKEAQPSEPQSSEAQLKDDVKAFQEEQRDDTIESPQLEKATSTTPAATGNAQDNTNFDEIDQKLSEEIKRLEQAVQKAENGADTQNATQDVTQNATQKENVEDKTQPEVEQQQTSQPASDATSPDANVPDSKTTNPDTQLPDSEELIDQNIFYLLGIHEGNEDEKEKFLVELQQIIWEDFLENDLRKLLSAEQQPQVEKILMNNQLEDLEKQEQVLDLIEDMIPNLDEIMKKKALEFKQDLVMDRVKDMKNRYQQHADALAKITQAEQDFQQGRWKTGSILLNEIVA